VEGKDPEPERRMPFFPNFVLRDLLLWLIVLNVLAFLAVFFPWELGHKADPLASAPAGIKPEWYFMFMFQTLKYLPAQIAGIDGEVLGIMAFSLGGLLWFLVPFLDRPSQTGVRHALVDRIGLAIIAYILALTILGGSHESCPRVHPPGSPQRRVQHSSALAGPMLGVSFILMMQHPKDSCRMSIV